MDAPDTAAVMFRREYEQELTHWLQQRFSLLCLTITAVGAVLLAISLLPEQTASDRIIQGIRGVVMLGIVIWFWKVQRPHFFTRDDTLRGATRLILALGLIWLLIDFALLRLVPGGQANPLLAIFVWHFAACLLLPWSPRESLRPVVPLMILWASGLLLLGPQPFTTRLLTVLLSPLVLLPGLAVTAWRLGRHSDTFRQSMIVKYFSTMRREVRKAREIHESMFPPPHDDGNARFQYAYHPMRELGGDFVHLHVGGEGLLHVVLIDVTGHGLPAAMTVNRLYGEIERIRGENPRAAPAEVLKLLNRYINLTMVKHGIFATAFAVTLDPYVGELTWANPAHPPGFLRSPDGRVTELPAGGVVLGALDDGAFTIGEQTQPLTPGDLLLLYTDGVFEAKGHHGEAFGLDRLRDLVRVKPPPRNWPQFIAAAVNKHLSGPAEDDVLIAALTFVEFCLETRPALELKSAAVS